MPNGGCGYGIKFLSSIQITLVRYSIDVAVTMPRKIPATLWANVCLSRRMRDQAVAGTRRVIGSRLCPKRATNKTASPETALQCPLIFHLSVMRSMNINCAIATALIISMSLGAPPKYIAKKIRDEHNKITRNGQVRCSLIFIWKSVIKPLRTK